MKIMRSCAAIAAAVGLSYLQGAAALETSDAETGRASDRAGPSALQASAKTTSKRVSGGQAAVALFRRRAEQYERDAVEAENAAEHYADLAQSAVAESSALVAPRTLEKLKEANINTWGRAALHMERMLDDPRPGMAAAAGLKARGIYDKRFNQYLASQATYGDAARGYKLRAGMDTQQAKQLRGYSDQLKLEGEAENAKTYANQAELLDEQAEKLKKVSENYGTMSAKLGTAAGMIESMAGKAQKFAEWQANPAGTPGDGDLWTYTIAPPIQFAPTTVAPMPPGMMGGVPPPPAPLPR